MSWLSRNAPAFEAVAATVTALVALAALVGVKIQLDEADRLQRLQSARDSYRAHLALAVEHPAFARPADACTLTASDKGAAYAAFVDHLLYSAEQMLAASDGWEETFLDQLAPHATYLCSAGGPVGETEETAEILTRFRDSACVAVPDC
ncbi:MAG: hypothetical protein WBB85_23365 [Albidovulum sp.]|uniref:hypothetical protein n=1 Tax=Albidovulum sp. TaxID=1872424 RepID=UPI003C7EFADA